MNNVYVSEIVATRLSHDLIGNIGAVANAVELMNDGDNDDMSDVLDILQFSSSVLSKRLKFFRLCFGLSGTTLKSNDDLQTIIQDYLSTLGNPKVPTLFEMHIETPQIYKIVMPAVMMMADTLIKGGKISVNQQPHGIYVTALSDSPLNQTKLQNIDLTIEGKAVEENPSTYAPLCYLLSYLKGSDVPVKRTENTLIIGE